MAWVAWLYPCKLRAVETERSVRDKYFESSENNLQSRISNLEFK